QIMAGPLSDRFGRRPMLLIGLSVYTLSGLGCALAGSIDQLVVLRFIQALAAATGPSMSRAIIRDYHGGPRASHMLSSVQLAMGFALVAAPIVGGLILLAVVWWGLTESLTLPDPQAAHPARLLKNIVAFFGNRICFGYALINGFIQGGLLAFISGIPFVMTDVFHVAPKNFGFY